MEERQRIIHCYYGSLTSFVRPIRTISEVARVLRFPRTTVSLNVNRFIAVGYDFRRMVTIKKSFVKMPMRLQRALLDPKLLQQWAPFSLLERTQIIERVFEYKMNKQYLHRFYRVHKVKWLRAKDVYAVAMKKRAELEPKRREFAVLLANVLAQKQVIYIDETTFTSRTT